MAAPVAASYAVWTFRDAKGQVARVRALVGAATVAALVTEMEAITTLFQAMSNAHVYLVTITSTPDHVYGTAANYQNVEDKATLTFLDVGGNPHRYQIPAPLTTAFLADEETVDAANANVSPVIAAFTGSVYGRPTDTAPLTFVGGLRTRRKLIRKFNIFTKNPTETGPGE